MKRRPDKLKALVSLLRELVDETRPANEASENDGPGMRFLAELTRHSEKAAAEVILASIDELRVAARMRELPRLVAALDEVESLVFTGAWTEDPAATRWVH